MKKLSLFISALTLFAAGSVCAEDTLNCKKLPSCDALGFTEAAESCIGGKYQVCPFDRTKVACIETPAVGDIKHSLNDADHDGWLLCNGRSYSENDYPELYAVLKNTFDRYLPDYRGFFLKGGTPSSVAVKESLPNIKGEWSDSIEDQKYQAPTGAIYQISTAGDGVNGDGGWFAYMKFDASKTLGTGHGVYKDGGHVIPANYATNIFIYAGKYTGK